MPKSAGGETKERVMYLDTTIAAPGEGAGVKTRTIVIPAHPSPPEAPAPEQIGRLQVLARRKPTTDDDSRPAAVPATVSETPAAVPMTR